MAEDTSASILTLVQPRRPKSGAERTRAYRERKKAQQSLVPIPAAVPAPAPEPVTVTAASLPEPVASRHIASRPGLGAILLHLVAFGLAAVGITMNGWFARSLGSSEVAGWLFLAIGVAADCVALLMPAMAANLWQGRRWATATAGWLVWSMTFAFALAAGIGFAAVNISDVTLARASRVTPAVVTAQAALNDAMAARDRECKGGVGKFCREREENVTRQRDAVAAAMNAVAASSDPQTEAAIRAVAWISAGWLRPTADDFGMARLILLALLPQIGGILLMIGRAERQAR